MVFDPDTGRLPGVGIVGRRARIPDDHEREGTMKAYMKAVGMVLLGLTLLTAGCGGSTSEPAVPTPEPTASYGRHLENQKTLTTRFWLIPWNRT